MISLSLQHCLVVLQALAGLVLITNVWDRKPVQDFVFCVPSVDRCKPKACVLTAPSEQKVCYGFVCIWMALMMLPLFYV